MGPPGVLTPNRRRGAARTGLLTRNVVAADAVATRAVRGSAPSGEALGTVTVTVNAPLLSVRTAYDTAPTVTAPDARDGKPAPCREVMVPAAPEDGVACRLATTVGRAAASAEGPTRESASSTSRSTTCGKCLWVPRSVTMAPG